MNEHKHYETEYGEAHDIGTYQTGSVKAPHRGSGLLAVILAIFVFLVGFLSAIGLISFQQLQQLLRQPDSAMPVDKGTLPPTTDDHAPLHSIDDPIPSIPDQTITLSLKESKHHLNPSGQLVGPEANQIYANNATSLVRIYCLTNFNSTLTGIGVVLTEDGYLLTNAHIVDSSSRVLVEFSDGSFLRAAVVGIDPFTDLAVLFVPRQDLVPAVFCYSSHLMVTEPTYAVEWTGNGSHSPSVRVSGVFSVGRVLSISQNSLSLVQTFDGTEQGPVFNSQGQIIGMQAGKISSYFHPDDIEGLGLIVPSDEILQVVHQLTDQGQIPGRPDLGMEVETISPLYQSYWNLPSGLMVTHIYPGSAAQQQDLRPGDILIALDGQRITNREELYRLLYSKQLGQKVTAVIYRDHKKFTVVLTIDERLMNQE